MGDERLSEDSAHVGAIGLALEPLAIGLVLEPLAVVGMGEEGLVAPSHPASESGRVFVNSGLATCEDQEGRAAPPPPPLAVNESPSETGYEREEAVPRTLEYSVL